MKIAVRMLYKIGKVKHGNAHHQGVAYVGRLNIRLLYALGISALIDMYIIIID
jgi:hypothetical protein